MKSMSTLRFTAGVGVNFSGTCGLRLVWRARKPLPCDHLVHSVTHSGVIRSSAQPARVGHTTAGPKLSTISWVPASLSKPPLDAVFSSVCLLLPFVHVALKLRSLQLHPPRCVASRYFNVSRVATRETLKYRRLKNTGRLGGSRWGWILQIKYRVIQTARARALSLSEGNAHNCTRCADHPAIGQQAPVVFLVAAVKGARGGCDAVRDSVYSYIAGRLQILLDDTIQY